MVSLLLLLAGEGTRLRPYTLDRPKCLVPFNGKEILQWQMAVYKKFPIVKKYAVTGYQAKSLDKFPELIKIHNGQFATTNICASLLIGLEEFLNSSPEGCELVISYGDIIFAENIFSKLVDDKHDFVTVVDKKYWDLWSARMDNPLGDLEVLKLSADNKILTISGKPKSREEIDAQYIGLTKLSYDKAKWLRDLLKKNDDQVLSLSVTHLFEYLIQKKKTEIYGCPVNGGWVEIDSVEDLKRLEAVASILLLK